MSDAIEFDPEACAAAEHWHGGQSSMLYAFASTGSLARGTIRPQSYEEDRPMTNDEWIADLASSLECEALRAIKSCKVMLKGTRGAERQDLQADLNGLRCIVSTIEEWRASRASR